ncbi:class I SAM-dependent methyltransferase [Pedobacter panaciterrae]|jgi:Trans-aconitate methyltransferase|uniref:class I SAM-dependent methyltransferase n=1 Tax=Pedobacter panaciterrae TaxID=363849 RepID=UPI00259A0432|nr:class I SAM-dependent methyltransferase [uncultured Pedobacter sp.]
MKILKAADAFNKSAKIYQDKFMDVSSYGDLLNIFCDNITADNASILDIACGPGNITKYLLNRRPDYKVLGIDLSSKMLELAQANNPTAKFELMDCREIDTIEEKFDGITCGFCLPYLTRKEAVALIASVPGLLNPGGVFYLSTMEEDDVNKSRYQISSTGDKVWVNYHHERYLTQAFQENNFEIINLKQFTSPDKDGLMITDLILMGKL